MTTNKIKVKNGKLVKPHPDTYYIELDTPKKHDLIVLCGNNGCEFIPFFARVTNRISLSELEKIQKKNPTIKEFVVLPVNSKKIIEIVKAK